MKIKTDFVTNSSSSCYVCDVCGERVSGWDLGICEAGMQECSKSHTFCQGHVVGDVTDEDKRTFLLSCISEEVNEKLRSLEGEDLVRFMEEDLGDWLVEMDYEMPQSLCPICSLKHVRDCDMVDYLLVEGDVVAWNRESLTNEIRDGFENLEELRRYVDENQK